MGDSFYYIVGRESCPWCVKAKDQLEQRGLQHKFRNLEKERALLSEYSKKYEWKTVPMIFKFQPDGTHEFLGGYTDLMKDIGGD